MRNLLLGEVGESLFIEGHKVGFLRRVTSIAKNSNVLVSTLYIIYGTVSFQHVFAFYDEVGFPSHSYLFDTNDGAPAHVRFAGNEMICQVDEDIFTEVIPADARPSYGNYPLVVTMPFEEGFKLSFTQIEDSSCTVQGTTELVSHGWENVVLGGQRSRLWLVGEYTNGQSGNRYWLDENRRVRLSHWQGAMSYWAATKEEALSDLPIELVKYANELFDTGNDSDWIAEIEEWLGQNG
jgi:hypothetical protein